MRIQVSKKKIVWLSIAIIFLLVVAIFLYLYSKKGFLSEIEQIEKYRDIYSECREEMKNGKKQFVCSAFLERIKKQEEGECFSFDFITTQGSLQKKEVCGDIKLLNWEKSILDYNYVLPVNVIFGEEISVERIADNEASLLLTKVDSKYLLDPIMTYEREKLLLEGYISVVGKAGMGFLYLNEIDIKNVEIVNGKFLVTFAMEIDGRKGELLVKTDKFWYLGELLEPEEYKDISIKENLNMTLNFIPIKSNFELNDLLEHCEEEIYEKNIECLHPEILDPSFPRVEEVKDSITQAISTDHLLEGFILSSIGRNE